jgi:hypothetical protein
MGREIQSPQGIGGGFLKKTEVIKCHFLFDQEILKRATLIECAEEPLIQIVTSTSGFRLPKFASHPEPRSSKSGNPEFGRFRIRVTYPTYSYMPFIGGPDECFGNRCGTDIRLIEFIAQQMHLDIE